LNTNSITAKNQTLGGSKKEKRKIVFVPYDEAYGKGFEDMNRRVPNIQKIKTLINWEPKLTLNKTLLRVINLFRSRISDCHGYLAEMCKPRMRISNPSKRYECVKF
jgi:hypothetical protein